MFDWNDEELTNIWGEAGESDDHIVPYPDQIEEKPSILFRDSHKKEANLEISSVNSVELKKPSVKSEHGVEPDSSSRHETHDSGTGFSLNTWPDRADASISKSAKVEQDSMISAASNNVAENSNNGPGKGESAQFSEDSELFQNPPDKEGGDFDDYGWANIGSFDDLDRIFSNSDPIFGDVSVGNVDELWPSSQDIASSPLKSTPFSGDSSDLPLGTLRTSSDAGQSFFPPFENDDASHHMQDVQASLDNIEYYGGKSKVLLEEKALEMKGKIQACHEQLDDVTAAGPTEIPDKGNKQKRLLTGQRAGQKSEVRQRHDLYGTWSSSGSPLHQVNSQYPPAIVNPCPPFVISQQRQLQRPELLQQKHFSGPSLASPLYGNVVNYYPAHSVSAQVEGNREQVLSGYEGPPSNASSLTKAVDAAVKPPAMSPKEKIEKLRRRQQMRAILAIQRQQEQFGNQGSVVGHSVMKGGSIEVDKSLSSFDDSSVEKSVLYRLQDTISQLDMRIRLCIRDSLFRLAQSAMRRQDPMDTRSTDTSRDEVLSSEDVDNQERFTRMSDIETDTNPIDRTVAHLLFHRPLESSGKSAETPESPLSANLSYERQENSLKTAVEKGYFPDNNQMSSPHGSKTRGVFSEGDMSKNSPCLDASGNAPSNENVDGEPRTVEASK